MDQNMISKPKVYFWNLLKQHGSLKERQTDRQTGSQTDRQTETDGNVRVSKIVVTGRVRVVKTNRQSDRQTDKN